MSSQQALPSGNPMGGRIINVQDVRAQDATGAWVPGRNVTYQLSSGHTGTVFVPLTQFTPENVRAAVMADAQTLSDVAGLTF